MDAGDGFEVIKWLAMAASLKRNPLVNQMKMIRPTFGLVAELGLNELETVITAITDHILAQMK